MAAATRTLALAAALAVSAARASDLEEPADLARRAAAGALRGQNRLLFETLDADGILRRRFGPPVWDRLTARQRERLRAGVREGFAAALASPRAGAGEVAWSAASDASDGAAVLLGLRFGERLVKTRWSLSRVAGGAWRIEDVLLSDPGVSLAEASLAALGPSPLRARDRRGEARRLVARHLAVLAGIGLVVAVFRRRLSAEKRQILYLTAAAPAILFAIGGVLAVSRSLNEPYELAQTSPGNPWDRSLRLAREAERAGDAAAAELWTRALAAGAPAGPVAYERGTLARERGDVETARNEFRAALAAPAPAPGAARELAVLALADGKNAEARDAIGRYLAATGPDPDGLSLEAVADANLGDAPKALAAIRRARELVGGGERGAELEARVRARAGDAAGAVAALREIEPGRPLDREALRSDPAFLPIANDPLWVAFVNEPPPPASAGAAPAR